MVSFAEFVNQCACGLSKLAAAPRCPKCADHWKRRAVRARTAIACGDAGSVRLDPPCECGSILALEFEGLQGMAHVHHRICLECGRMEDLKAEADGGRRDGDDSGRNSEPGKQ